MTKHIPAIAFFLALTVAWFSPLPCAAWENPESLAPRQASVVLLQTVTSPSREMTGVSFDAGDLWVLDSSSFPKIYKIDQNGDEITNFTTPRRPTSNPDPTGLAFDGVNLWLVDFAYSEVFQLDTNGDVVDSFNGPIDPSGAAWDGTNLWVASWRDDNIYKIDIATQNVERAFRAPNWEDGLHVFGLAYDGQNLLVSDQDGLYKVDPDNGTVLETYIDARLQNKKAYGLGWDGSYLWAASNVGNDINQFDLSDQPAPDEGPKVVSVYPADGVTVDDRMPTIKATFNEGLKSSTVTDSSFTVLDVSGKAVYDHQSRTISFVYEDELEQDKWYTVTITNDIQDLDGNKMEGNYTWKFKIAGPSYYPENPGGCFLETVEAGGRRDR